MADSVLPPTPGSSRIRSARVSLDISIVGAGIGGLTVAYLLGRAGHRVRVFEASPELHDLGAGIQLSPNATKLLARHGILESLKPFAVCPPAGIQRRYNTGDIIGLKKRGNYLETLYGAPHYVLHRADLFRVLLKHAQPYANVLFNCKVVDMDPSAGSITLESGQVIASDLVIGADGVHSRIRDFVAGPYHQPKPTGDACYRAVIPTSELLRDPELKDLIVEGVNCWMGPNRHIVGYSVRGGELYNIVMIHPCRQFKPFPVVGNCEEMKKEFVDFEPRVHKLLSLIKSTIVWSLLDSPPLESWLHVGGRVCLLGDACHPMLPYRAQGAVMTIEDAFVLGNLLTTITERNQLHELLNAYQHLRYDRVSELQRESRMNQHVFHLPDGPEQEKRDQSMRSSMEEHHRRENVVGNTRFLEEKQRERFLLGYDADNEVEKWLMQTGTRAVVQTKL